MGTTARGRNNEVDKLLEPTRKSLEQMKKQYIQNRLTLETQKKMFTQNKLTLDLYKAHKIILTKHLESERRSQHFDMQSGLIMLQVNRSIKSLSNSMNRIGGVVNRTGSVAKKTSSTYSTMSQTSGEYTMSTGDSQGSSPEETTGIMARIGKIVAYGFKKSMELGVKTFKIFEGLLVGFIALQALKKVPSALAAAVDLLEFGFLFLLKPLADLLYPAVMGIAKTIIGIAVWFHKMPPFWQKVVGALELIVIGVAVLGAGLAGLLGGRANRMASGVVKGTISIGEWLAKLVTGNLKIGEWLAEKFPGVVKFVDWLDTKVTGVIDDIGEWLSKRITGTLDILEWLDKKVMGFVDISKAFEKWIGERITGAIDIIKLIGSFIKGKAISVWEFLESLIKNEKGVLNLSILEKPLKFLEETFLKVSKFFEETLGKLKGVFKGIVDDGVIGKAVAKISEWLGDKGLLGILSKAFTGLGRIMGDGVVSLIAYVVSWISGWIATKLGNNPFAHLFRLLEDMAYAVGRTLDPFNWIINIAEDLWNALHGDFSFKNTINEIKGILLDLYNCFIDIYNFFGELIARLKGKTFDPLDRMETKLGETEGEIITQAEHSKRTSEKTDEAADDMDEVATHTETLKEKFAKLSPQEQAYSQAQEDHSTRGSNPYGKNSDGSIKVRSSRNAALGGIVTSPVHALVGESGPEAIVPLSKNNSNIANAMSGLMGNGTQQPVNITFSGLVDEMKFRNIIREESNKIFNSYRKINGSTW